jgi:hypothetical protein
MNNRRGDVVILDYPFSDSSGAKVRPALVSPAQTLLITSAAFCPPKPKLVDMAVRTGTVRALFGT